MHGNELHPWQEKDRRWRYRPAEVARAILLRNAADPHTEGKVAAQAFAMFQQQSSLAEVVIATEQPATAVKQLFADYAELTGAILLSAENVATLREAAGLQATASGDALASAAASEIARRYTQGLEDGRAEAEDFGEIVDPKTGERRRVPPR